MADTHQQWSDWRNRIIGLGEQSTRKNYYPELLRSLDELKASESDLRTLFDSVSDAIFIHDDQGRVADVNDAMLSMYRVSREQAIGFSIADYSAPGPQHERLPAIFAELSTRTRLLFEWKARRPTDGSLFDAEVALHSTRWKNQGMIVAVVRDITERKQAEEKSRELEQQLMQAQKMESVGRLAGGVAHDFNNMLQAILGNASLALQEMSPDHPCREYLEEIQKSAQRSADLTRQLLAFARKQTINPKPLDLNDTVTGMRKMLMRLIGEDIRLEWIPRDIWVVRMDPGQIDQILANLVVNARDAIAGAGWITIETAKASLDGVYAEVHPECEPGDYVMLAVSDSGCGMDEHTKARLFEPFFTTKGQGKGTGLGLATVFGIVKQNRGHISVYSELGKGTTFKIYFPRCDAQAEPAPQKASPRFQGGTETVLVVEDEIQVLNLARRILQQQGYHILLAHNPEMALELADLYREPIQLLMTDVIMPHMNGKELQTRLQARFPEMRCLFMSGYTHDAIAHHGVLEHGVHFLQKPFSMQSLTDKVREVLDEVRQ